MLGYDLTIYAVGIIGPSIRHRLVILVVLACVHRLGEPWRLFSVISVMHVATCTCITAPESGPLRIRFLWVPLKQWCSRLLMLEGTNFGGARTPQVGLVISNLLIFLLFAPLEEEVWLWFLMLYCIPLLSLYFYHSTLLENGIRVPLAVNSVGLTSEKT